MNSNMSEMPEFIFGHLSTTEGRLERVKTTALGLTHDATLNPLDPQEHQAVQITVKVGSNIAVKAVTLYYTTDGTLPLVKEKNTDSSTRFIPMGRIAIAWNTLLWSYLETWVAEIPGQRQGTNVQYAISAITTTNEIIYCPHLENTKNPSAKSLNRFKTKDRPQIYSFYVDNEVIPNWFREAVIYQIFVDRFAATPPKNFVKDADLGDFLGGTIQGIISKLDYLQTLGVNCLWLTPIFLSPSHHGYDPVSHSLIEPRLGTEKDWEILINAAHQRGIKIILDYVANHFSNKHPLFQKAQTQEDSEFYDWFRFSKWPDEYECFFDVPGQPEINSEHQAVRDYLIDHACDWLRKGCDGFRLDYAHGLSQAFWSSFHAATRQLQPESITLGEITEPPDVLLSFAGRMDGCLDFKVLELFRSFFCFNTLTVSEFDQQLRQHLAYFGDNLVLPSFLDNHDMNRFLWTVEGDKRRLKLAALCQFSLPHPPIIYYGTEVGLSQVKAVGRLEESRLPMLWGDDQDQELFSFYQQLIAWRSHKGKPTDKFFQPLIIDDSNKVYVYSCGDHAVVLNNNSLATMLTLKNSENQRLIFSTDFQVNYNSQTGQLSLPAYSGAIVPVTLTFG